MRENRHKGGQDKFFYLTKLPYIHEIELGVASHDQFVSGDWVVAETRYGVDLVRILGLAKSYSEKSESKRHTSRILRESTTVDFEEMESNNQLSIVYEDICREKIIYRKLDMKLIKVHILHGRSKVIVFFTAEQRVDFRDLVRDLVAEFHTRIELRQIGVRDETRSLGGIAMCGREYCCHKINDQLKPATIKMVKDQSLSLNSSKISGGCGRLLCCLAYESDTYAQSRNELPSEGSIILLENIRYRVSEVHILTQEVTVVNCEDSAIKPFKVQVKNFRYQSNDNCWIETKDSEKGKEHTTKKLVMTPCGCARPEGTRCKGCTSQL
ncbi:PSP1 domain-containing protein [Entomospira entomophila]|uniref:PSP1 C-terminal domain-containing protein n=1 Tax=Entomospira entomophila TaxID=2719988 RepID=A0A968GA81_9SPIO|nr:regulatory iron-sulfur-containing complex subunit RicT [Entomospira entomophilus]NIZ40660.1 hypothetical protein [Entomospira entomophilus]